MRLALKHRASGTHRSEYTSYELYLVHCLMLGLVGTHIKELGGIFVFLICSFGGAWIYHKIWESIKSEFFYCKCR